MIWLLALLPLAMAYLYRPGMWHTCAWGQLAADPRPPVFILLAVMYMASLLWAAVASTLLTKAPK